MRASFHIVDLSSGKSRCFRVLAAIACRMQNLSEQFLSFAQQSQFESARKLWDASVVGAGLRPETLMCDYVLKHLGLAKPADMAQRKKLGRDYVYAGIDY